MSSAVDKSELKRQIRTLKTDVQTALEAKDAVKAKRLRRKVKLLKRATRSLVKSAKPSPSAPTEAKAS